MVLASAAFILLAASVAEAAPDVGGNWAILVAGSRGYYNYRHQADLCHAYHVLVSHGIPPDHIISMAYDDVAHHYDNPFPGKLFNHPEGEDVYAGCKIDYTGHEVTPDNFVAVLTGDRANAPEGKPVLGSTSADRVFVYFVDHGAVDLVAFPSEVLHSATLNAALIKAYSSQLFRRLVFYLETCESGSMFEGVLPLGLPIYAVTAANAHESSWGTYCPPHDEVRGKSLGTCLGDLFSVSWLEDSDKALAMQETLHDQFERVKTLTNKSHVMQFGDLAISFKEEVGAFEGAAVAKPGAARRPVQSRPVNANEHARDLRLESAVDSREVTMHSLHWAFHRSRGEDEGRRLAVAMDERRRVNELWACIARSVVAGEGGDDVVDDDVVDDDVVAALLPPAVTAPGGAVSSASPRPPLDRTYMACHVRAVDAVQAGPGWSEFALPHSATLHRLCAQVHGDATRVVEAVRACSADAARERENHAAP